LTGTSANSYQSTPYIEMIGDQQPDNGYALGSGRINVVGIDRGAPATEGSTLSTASFTLRTAAQPRPMFPARTGP
jgi:hypothetical protein